MVRHIPTHPRPHPHFNITKCVSKILQFNPFHHTFNCNDTRDEKKSMTDLQTDMALFI